MLGVNKVILVGHVGSKQVNFNQTTGEPIVNLSLATTQGYKNKETNEWIDQTQWHRIVMFKNIAQVAHQYIQKGHLLYIEGSLKYRKYTGKDGVEKISTEIIANELKMMSKKDNSKTNPSQEEENPYKPNIQS